MALEMEYFQRIVDEHAGGRVFLQNHPVSDLLNIRFILRLRTTRTYVR